jgi:hypothetical protein
MLLIEIEGPTVERSIVDFPDNRIRRRMQTNDGGRGTRLDTTRQFLTRRARCRREFIFEVDTKDGVHGEIEPRPMA